MEWYGAIDVDDEPLLLLDQDSIAFWGGIADDGADYARACSVLEKNVDGGTLQVGNRFGFIWYPEGAGTVDIFKPDNNTIIILRSWLTVTTISGNDIDVIRDFSHLSTLMKTKIGEVNFVSGKVAITPATNSEREITRFQNTPLMRSSESQSVIFIALPSGTYQCSKGEVTNANGSAISLIVERNYV